MSTVTDLNDRRPSPEADPLAEDWTTAIGPLAAAHAQDVQDYADHVRDMQRHTIDIDRQPMSVEDELREISTAWRRTGLFVMFLSGAVTCYALEHWVLR